MKKIILFSFFTFLYACQPVEKINDVVFDYNQFSKFDILSNSIEIKEIFEKKIVDPYIGHTLNVDPSERVINWVNGNFSAIGNENKFIITIIDASLTQTQFQNKKVKNFNEKNNFKYELFYLIEFSLYDSFNNILASTLVETSRSTTSGVYISIQEKENIINDLIYLSLVDLSNESNELIKKYMGDFIL
tara:strand:- start:432 stop:998 length:567 start_codon:yes stop_codon:yes gene_type:complete